MRIATGIYGGRVITAPKSAGTRPMTDKVRTALFDILGPLDGKTVLDAYAGSGAIGFEALSRGAARVTAIEMATGAVKTLQANQAYLGLGIEYGLVRSKVEAWLARPQTQSERFDLIIADPP